MSKLSLTSFGRIVYDAQLKIAIAVKHSSAFTGAFLDILQNDVNPDKDGILTASEIGAYFQRYLAEHLNGRPQTPCYQSLAGSEGGDFIFSITSNPSSVPQPEPIVDLFAEARSCYLRDDFTGAIKVLDQLLERNPDKYESYYLKAMALVRLEKYPEAMENFDRTLKPYPEYLPALVNKSMALVKNKSYESTIVQDNQHPSYK